MHLLYITDVFCPWSYGFIPVMRRLSRDHPSLPVRVLGGNLVESPQRISEMLEEHPALPAFFERLEQTTGQTTARFRELVKASSGGEQNWLMHSAAMNLPLAALRRLAPGHELEQMEAFEEGFYSEARDVMAPAFWDRVAARWGISQARLQTALHDPAVQQAAEEDAREAEDIMGEFCLYPTLYLEQGAGRTLLARGYVPYERVQAVARAEEAQKQAQSKSAAMISIADRLASMSEVMASASSQLAERISQADQAS